jgi:hypothetical protein
LHILRHGIIPILNNLDDQIKDIHHASYSITIAEQSCGSHFAGKLKGNRANRKSRKESSFFGSIALLPFILVMDKIKGYG